MPGKYTSDEEKACIIAWRQEKMPIKVICERSGRGKATIMRLLALFPSISLVEEEDISIDTIIKQELQKNSQLTALELQNLHPELLQQVKIQTVQYRLQKDLDLPSCKAAKKPLINERMKNQRLAFAKHAHWTTEQWRKVMFSNESNFQVFKMGSTTMQCPRPSDCFDPLHSANY